MSHLSESTRDPYLPDANLGNYLLFPTLSPMSVNIPNGNGLEKVVKMLANRASEVSAYKH
jgi:hypothetical protein